MKPPCSISDTVVRRQEKRLTPAIIWMEDILYWVKSSPCQLEVKLSKSMYPTNITSPEVVVTVSLLRVASWLVNKNMDTPTEIMTAVIYSYAS